MGNMTKITSNSLGFYLFILNINAMGNDGNDDVNGVDSFLNWNHHTLHSILHLMVAVQEHIIDSNLRNPH